MAGEQLLKLMKGRGGNDSDYSDIVFGTVINVSPLQIQISNQMVLTEAFLNLSRNVTDHKIRMRSENSDEDKWQTYIVLNALKKGDGVTMIRQDGGQQFYVLEKTGGDEDE